jgi:hypothetical protein
MRFVVLLAMLSSGCAGPAQSKCSAVRSERRSSESACEACLDRLAVHGTADLCQDVCLASSKSVPVALASCSAAAAENVRGVSN